MIRKLVFGKKNRGPFDDAPVVIISFPKSGRTWHRMLLGAYLVQETGWPFESALKTRRLCKAAGVPKTVYTHNGANFLGNVHYSDPSVASVEHWANRDIFLIVRDPRDVLISAFHHAKYRSGVFDGDLATFIRSPTTGIDKVLTALNRWHDGRHLPTKFAVTSYEALHRDAQEVLRETIAFLGLQPRDDFLRKSVELSTFDKMKEYERADLFRNSRMNSKTQDERGSKVREGKVGGYRDYLSEADVAYLEERTRTLGNPFAEYSQVSVRPATTNKEATQQPVHEMRFSQASTTT